MAFIRQGIWYIAPLVFEKIEEDENLWDFFIGSVLEVSSVIVCYFLIDSSLRRVGTLTISSFILVVSMLGICFLGEKYFGDLSNVGRFGTQIAFNVLFLYTPEIYEISLRGIGTGIANSLLDFGALVMPFILIPLFNIQVSMPFQILAVLSVGFLLSNIFLPKETMGKHIH